MIKCIKTQHTPELLYILVTKMHEQFAYYKCIATTLERVPYYCINSRYIGHRPFKILICNNTRHFGIILEERTIHDIAETNKQKEGLPIYLNE